MITKTVVKMAAVKCFLGFVLVVGEIKVLCFPSGESDKLKTLSLQGLQGHLHTSGSSGGSPAATTTKTKPPAPSQTTSLAAIAQSVTDSGTIHVRSLDGCRWVCPRRVCFRHPCCFRRCNPL
ncbi:hypothetical protein UPYG_G00349680 [Umbra pygmaea]|uniref:Secreted protein n=1 Tax=Umbra pygmaea TaxID=75934 RepID=A0ABD0VXY9_UMBPY